MYIIRQIKRYVNIRRKNLAGFHFLWYNKNNVITEKEERKMNTAKNGLRHVNVLGFSVDNVTPDEAAKIIENNLSLSPDKPRFTVTPNPTMLMAAGRDPELADAIRAADLSLADGIGIVGAAKRAGTPLPSRVTGIDTGFCAMKSAAKLGVSVFLLGGKPGVAPEAAKRLVLQIPGLVIAGTRDGYFDREGGEDENVISQVVSSGAGLLILCLGSPRQEIWAHRHLDELAGVRQVMTLGGALDVWAGRTHRAPRVLRAVHLEWLWRMLCQPKRFAYLPDLVAFRLKTSRIAVRRKNKNGKNS